jgi:archaetidylinositol phosphate synthase
LARLAVRPLARTSISPNALTLLGMACGLVAAVLFARGMPYAHVGAAIFMFAVWMDHVDGEHARATRRTSRFGHYLDHAAAMTTYVSMFVGAGIGLASGGLGPWAVPLGIAAGVSVVVIFTVRMWAENRLGLDAVKQNVRGGFEIEDTLYIVGPVTWLGGLEPFVLAAGIGAPLFMVWVLWETHRDFARHGARI